MVKFSSSSISIPLSRNEVRPASAAVAPVNGCVSVSPNGTKIVSMVNPTRGTSVGMPTARTSSKTASRASLVVATTAPSSISSMPSGPEEVLDRDGRLDLQVRHTQEGTPLLRGHRHRPQYTE